MKDSEVLSLAADVVLNGWSRDAYAQDKNGAKIYVMRDDVVGFCAVGATARVLGGSVKAADVILEKWVVPLLPMPPTAHQRTVRRWNDDFAVNKEEVANLLRSASDVAKLKGE